MSEDLRELAFRLHVRGFASDAIASALKREHGATITAKEIDGWIGARLDADPESDPQHTRTVAVITEANRELWKAASVPNLQPADKARYLTAVARNEERLIKIDGRCGARLVGVRGKFCTRFPVVGKRRCQRHAQSDTASGVASTKGARPARPTGRTSDLTPKIRAEIVDAIRAGNDNVVAAGAQGVSTGTFYRWLERGAPDAPCHKVGPDGVRDWSACRAGKHAAGACPGNARFRDFRESVERARYECEVSMSGYVAHAAPTDKAAAQYILERRFPDRWKQQQRIETSRLSDDAPFEIRLIPNDRTQAELDEITAPVPPAVPSEAAAVEES